MYTLITDQAGALRITDIDAPRPGAGEIGIDVQVASVNPVDTYVRNGFAVQQGGCPQVDSGLGWDAVDTIAAVGADVDGSLPLGARVAALIPGAVKPLGAQAGVVASASATAVIPDGLDPTAAATVPLNGLTALAAVDLAGEPRGALLVTRVREVLPLANAEKAYDLLGSGRGAVLLQP